MITLELIIIISTLFQIFTGINIRRMSSNDIKVELYVLNAKYESLINIPLELKKIYQIEAGTSGKYSVSSGNSVSVNKFGTIFPINTTWYWYGGMGSTTPKEGKEPDRIETTFNEGTSEITATVGSNTFKITVTVKNYGDEYVEKIFDSYIKTNITNKKSTLEKFKSITAFPAQYPYNYRYQSYIDMVIFQGGDCWASSNTIQHLCEKVGIKSHVRFAARDPGSGTGHRNVAALIDGKIYIGEAGYGYNYANRKYSVYEKNVGFFYKSSITNNIVIYQYDGYDENINVPSTIDGKTVIGFEQKCFSVGESWSHIKIKKITLPNTITNLGDLTFNDLLNLLEVNIPFNVSSININTFNGSDNLTTINVDEKNSNYSSVDGVLFNKNKTLLIKFPPGKKGKFISPNSVQIIGENSFYKAKNLEIVKLHQNVKTIGENAFYDSNIKEIYFFGNKPEFGKNSLKNLNVTIYYPVGDSSWNISVFENLGIKEIKLNSWVPKEEEIKNKSNTALVVVIIIAFIIIFGVLAFFLIKKRREKTSNDINSIRGGLIKG